METSTTICLSLIFGVTASAAVVMWCIERRIERGSFRETKIKFYVNGDEEKWDILNITERKMKQNKGKSHLN